MQPIQPNQNLNKHSHSKLTEKSYIQHCQGWDFPCGGRSSAFQKVLFKNLSQKVEFRASSDLDVMDW